MQIDKQKQIISRRNLHRRVQDIALPEKQQQFIKNNLSQFKRKGQVAKSTDDIRNQDNGSNRISSDRFTWNQKARNKYTQSQILDTKIFKNNGSFVQDSGLKQKISDSKILKLHNWNIRNRRKILQSKISKYHKQMNILEQANQNKTQIEIQKKAKKFNHPLNEFQGDEQKNLCNLAQQWRKCIYQQKPIQNDCQARRSQTEPIQQLVDKQKQLKKGEKSRNGPDGYIQKQKIKNMLYVMNQANKNEITLMPKNNRNKAVHVIFQQIQNVEQEHYLMVQIIHKMKQSVHICQQFS